MPFASPTRPAGPLSVPAPLADHEPILIDGDEAFTAANGVTSGNGTEGNPFVIENWTISARTQTGIEVRNTVAAFTIRNVTVADGWDTSQRGVVWYNVLHAKLEASNLSRNYHGVEVTYAHNFTIVGTTIDNPDFYGIWIGQSNQSFVVGNAIDHARVDGIAIRESLDVTIKDNDVVDNGGGVSVYGSNDVRIFGNRIVGSQNLARDVSGTNAWDAGYPRGGNFWSDYKGWDDCRGPAQDVCPGSDGLGDFPYPIDGGAAVDHYPLVPNNPPNAPPVVAFGYSGPVYPNTRFTLDASTSYDPEGYPLRFAWDFGDGTRLDTEYVAYVDHVYSKPGLFQVTLSATDRRGATSAAVGQVRVESIPQPAPLVLRPYEHPTAGFRLPIPEGWSVHENVPQGNLTMELVLLGPFTNGLQTNVLVDTDEDSTVQETDAYLGMVVDETVSGIRRSNPSTSVDVLEGPTFLRIADHAAVTFKLQYGTGEYFQKIAIVVSEPHRRYWLLVLTTDGQSYPVMAEGFDRMLTGFEITRPAFPPTVSPPMGGPSLALILGGIVGAVVGAVLVGLLAIRSRKPPSVPTLGSAPWMPPSAPVAPMISMGLRRFCPACGVALPIGVRFCGKCGSAIPVEYWATIPGPPPGT